MPRPSRLLYVMVKPPPAVADLLHAHPWTDRMRPAGLLHVTILSICDAADLSRQALGDLRRRLGTVAAAPFRLAFDLVRANGR